MIKVVIADDEALVRAGLRGLLEPTPDLEVVSEAEDGREAVEAALRYQPDVLLMDIRMPVLDGLRALEQVARLERAPRVIMLTTFDLDDYVHRALRAGAAGFLLKDTPPVELTAAIRTVAAGNAMLAPTVTQRLITAFAEQHPERARRAREKLTALTERERGVINAVAKGLSNADIAKELLMSEATVKAHVSRSLAKLGLTNRVQAAILAHDAGEG
ncbi:response regulator transcription factor [Amycolatopsis sp. 195334CR]|uniref:response regulator n=1 Tax=Amycolatopsis sp. 195334CR TaxID=2814588 RepID=UPI001A8C1CA0|nr:response regulator transcription factor [Amycolatopsis sp. 195334CR]MBN6040980.1 response regulator transcription factor [Amycolatopsis sp. 195334CR]